MTKSVEEAYAEWLELYNRWLEKQEEYESLRSGVDKAFASKAAVIGVYPPIEVFDELEKLLGELNDLVRKIDTVCRNLDLN